MSAGYCNVNTGANGFSGPRLAILARMGKKPAEEDKLRERKRTELADWQIEDANRLAVIWDGFRRKNRARGVGKKAGVGSQQWLAEQCGMKQSAASFYINGKIALNLPALLKFSKVLKFKPEQVSPTLAKQLEVVRVGDNIYSAQALNAAATIDNISDEQKRKLLLELVAAMGATPATNDRVKEHYTEEAKLRRAGNPTLTRAIPDNSSLPLPFDDKDDPSS